MECFTLKNLSFSYPEQQNKTIDGLDLTIHAGEFVTLCGPSGCGKTTLLRQLKPALAPHGVLEGEIFFENTPLRDLPLREQSARIGFVLQNPDNQIVTDKVWHELAFGLESLGFDTPTIRRRVAEMASFFGIENWFYKDVSQLSGGQKQLLNLAAIMAMQPSVLILDEPTSQLDPIAASDFLATVGRINRELGTTVICTEHRLEEVFPHSHRVLVMDKGRLIADGTPAQVGEMLKESGHRMFASMPTPMQVYAAVPNSQHCPVTVRDGRDWLDGFAKTTPLKAVPAENIPARKSETPAAKLEEVWFRYEQDSPDITKGLDLEVYPGELVAILGGNGAGKSTTLSLLAGLHKPYRGKVSLFGKEGTQPRPGLLGVLPQDPKSLFVKNTVGEDLADGLKDAGLSREVGAARLGQVIGLCHLEELLSRHPFDLSGGEQQRAALAKVLLQQPRMLLLDEPTKGLDTAFQEELAVILRRLTDSGVAILMVSHDIGFCARHAHRCALFFDGVIAAQGTPRAFFSGNSFYTTAANRMARHLLPDAVTPEDIIAACEGVLPGKPYIPDDSLYPPLPPEELEEKTAKEPPKPLAGWRKVLAGIAGFMTVGLMGNSFGWWPIDFAPLSDLVGKEIGLLFWLAVLGLSLVQKSRQPALYSPSQKLDKRTWAALLMILIAIPLTIAVGYFYFGDRRYYLISLLILAETMLPFFLVFEHRKPQARELILIAVLCAMGMAGRMAFMMLPNFKPVTALVIIAAVALGGETGFLVGALTMLLSNMYFQQGPWTPYQMFAMGIIGLLAGVLFRKGLLRRNRLSLSLFGFVSAFLIYGGVMNPAAMLMYQPTPSWKLLIAYYVQGVPVDLVHAVSTFLFLWLLSEPMLEKLDRIKTKYGFYHPQ